MSHFSKVTISWATYPTSISIKNHENASSTVFSVGDFVWFEEREEGAGVLITEIRGSKENEPIGVVYLPWRYEKECWATRQISLRGDARFLICPPGGSLHYGLHINWTSIKKIETVDHPLFQQKVEFALKEPAEPRFDR